MTYVKVLYMIAVAVLYAIVLAFLFHLCGKTIYKLEKYARENGYIVRNFTKQLIACACIIAIGAVIVLSFMYVSYILVNY